MRVLLVLLAATGCVDLTVTLRVPCSASAVRDTAATADTVFKWTADTLGCPRKDRP